MAIQQQTAPTTNQGVVNTGNQTQQSADVLANQPVEIQQLGESIFKKWWFWAIVGIIVIGGISLFFLL